MLEKVYMADLPRKTACIEVGGAEGRRQTRTTLPGLDLAKCLLCQSEKKQLKNRRLLEKPLRCTLDSAARTLINAARSRSDVRVLVGDRKFRFARQGHSLSFNVLQKLHLPESIGVIAAERIGYGRQKEPTPGGI